MKKLKQFFTMNLLILAIILLSMVLNIRICPIYNLFKIPCPGCGLTRALSLIIKGDFAKSLNYNPMIFVIIFLYIVFIIWTLIDLKMKKNSFSEFTTKYKKIIITIAVVFTMAQWIMNLQNPLLY